MLPIKLRPAKPSDTNFILSNWLNHYKKHSNFAKKISSKVFFPFHQPIVKLILSRNTTKVIMVCDDEEPDLVFGFLVYETLNLGHIVHFTFVKENFRRMKLCKRMFESAGISESFEFTHWTNDINDIVKKYSKMIYNPYKL